MLLGEKAKADQTALNEIKERARYQNESADLREQLANTMEQYSQLSKLRVEDSKKILSLQSEAGELRSQVTELEQQIADRDELLGKNARFNKYLEGLLRDKGVILRKKKTE
jgi:peptidoglycan hydrolase CwlO-like protein